MQILRLRLQNFRQHEDTELVLGAGLTGIVGPNGAGKSTLLEAIAFAMYGTTAARGTRDSIRRRGAPPRSTVRVELDFALGPHQFRVVRGLTQAELFQDGDPAPMANSLGAVTEKLTRLLGMTRAEFFNTYFTGQKELAVMGQMTGPERAQFLSRVLGFERLRTAQERLRERRNEVRARLQALQAGLPDPEDLRAEEHRVAELSAQAAEREQARRKRSGSRPRPIGRGGAALEGNGPAPGACAFARGRPAGGRAPGQTSQERTRELDRQITEALQAQTHLAALAEVLARSPRCGPNRRRCSTCTPPRPTGPPCTRASRAPAPTWRNSTSASRRFPARRASRKRGRRRRPHARA